MERAQLNGADVEYDVRGFGAPLVLDDLKILRDSSLLADRYTS